MAHWLPQRIFHKCFCLLFYPDYKDMICTGQYILWMTYKALLVLILLQTKYPDAVNLPICKILHFHFSFCKMYECFIFDSLLWRCLLGQLGKADYRWYLQYETLTKNHYRNFNTKIFTLHHSISQLGHILVISHRPSHKLNVDETTNSWINNLIAPIVTGKLNFKMTLIYWL